MAKQKLEIECPVCDAKISIDARSCPRCGADLGMADFQDLENLAKDISEGRPYSGEVYEKVSVEEIEEETVTKEEVVVIPPKAEPKPDKKESKKDSIPKAVPVPPAEPKIGEPKKEEPKKPEPKREEPKKEEARKPEPGKEEEPKKVEQKKEELRKPEVVAEEEEEAPEEKGKKKGLFSKFFGKKK